MIDIFTGAGTPLTQDGFDGAAKALGIAGNRAALWALLSVETRGFGYLLDKRPKILFERHVFHARTDGRFSAEYPDVSNPASGGYEGGAAEYQRLKRAMLLDRRAALESASWGLGQVMGFNASVIGHPSVEAMIVAFMKGEDEQLAGSVAFITAKRALADALRAQNWPQVAFFYNGKNFAKNHYDIKLAQAHMKYTAKAPDLAVRELQALLAFAGFDPGGIDGEKGDRTTDALKRFKRTMGNVAGVDPADDAVNDAVRAALKKLAGFVG